MSLCASAHITSPGYFAIGLALLAVGLAGQPTFVGIGIAWLALAAFRRRKQDTPQ